MEVEVELSRIIINETSDQQVIVLKEKNGERSFPIVIGIVEIFAIDRRLKKIQAPRPMTHDLLDEIIGSLGARIEKIVITDLKNHTFYGNIILATKDGILEIDSRPSDAIALAVGWGAPIYADEQIFEKTSH